MSKKLLISNNVNTIDDEYETWQQEWTGTLFNSSGYVGLDKDRKIEILEIQGNTGDEVTLHYRNFDVVITNSDFEAGNINTKTGENTTGSYQSRNKDFIEIPSYTKHIAITKYKNSIFDASYCYYYFYDVNKNYLGYNFATYTSQEVNNNAKYVRMVISEINLTNYKFNFYTSSSKILDINDKTSYSERFEMYETININNTNILKEYNYYMVSGANGETLTLKVPVKVKKYIKNNLICHIDDIDHRSNTELKLKDRTGQNDFITSKVLNGSKIFIKNGIEIYSEKPISAENITISIYLLNSWMYKDGMLIGNKESNTSILPTKWRIGLFNNNISLITNNQGLGSFGSVYSMESIDITINPTTINLYYNTKLTNTLVNDGLAINDIIQLGACALTDFSYSSEFYLRSLKIYNRDLTIDEIKQNYNYEKVRDNLRA